MLAFWLMKTEMISLASGTISAFIFLFEGLDYKIMNVFYAWQGMGNYLETSKKTIEFCNRKPIMVNGSIVVGPEVLQGSFQLRNVSFEYPSRPGIPSSMLFGLNVDVAEFELKSSE